VVSPAVEVQALCRKVENRVPGSGHLNVEGACDITGKAGFSRVKNSERGDGFRLTASGFSLI